MKLFIKRKQFNFNFVKKCWKKRSLLKFGILGFCFLKTIIFNKPNYVYFCETIKKDFKILKKNFKFWNKLYYSFNVFKKSKGSRMGKGKGKLRNQSIYVRKGDIIFEFFFWSFKSLKHILINLKNKFKYPIKILKGF